MGAAATSIRMWGILLCFGTDMDLSNQLVIRCLSTDYGIEATTLTRLPLGADQNASVYQAHAQTERSYFVKLKRGPHSDSGVEVIELLQQAGIQQIIPPIKTFEGQSICRVGDCTLLVYPFVKGENGLNRDLMDRQWVQLGKTLKQIHEVEVPLALQTRIRRETYSPQWREAVRLLLVQIEGEPNGDPIALKLRALMKEKRGVIRQLVDCAEQLNQEIQNQSPSPFVLCHSDIHAGNVLVDENDAFYIVDWDDPILAPKERDLMFIGGGVANVWNKPHEETLFYQGYGKTKVNAMILAYYRHERIVEDIALYGQELLLTTAGGEKRLEMYKQFIDMFEPQGVVDLALRTTSP